MMISKFVTIAYLISLCCTLWMTYRRRLCLADELMLNKVVTILLSGYSVAVTYIYADVFHGDKPLLCLAMLTLCPFVFVLLRTFKTHNYSGDLNILIVVLMLTSIGLVTLYRLNVASGWSLTRAFGYGEDVPMVLKQLVYSMVALYGMTVGLVKGIFRNVIKGIEVKGHTLIWGLAAFALLALPKVLGASSLLAQDKSFQPSEFVFKVIFLVFVAKYYSSRSSELVKQDYSLREILKLVLFISSGITVFFFFPLVFLQKELGTALLIGLSFIILTAYVTGRVSLFLAGLMLIVAALWVGVFLDGHVEKRLIGAWLEWREFAFKPFREGERLYPGYQLFTAIASIRLSPWGVGIGNGVLIRLNDHQTVQTVVPKAVHDFIAVPIMSELGILAIAVIALGYLVLVDKAIKKHKSLRFRNILATGISIALMTQGLYNLSCVTALLPTTGIPLPWLSYGGSAAFANYILTGLLMTALDNDEGARHEK